ncbi:Rnase E [Rhodococcus phage ReqiPine5]|uniref:Gp63 n=1 Tax=Rhodococcus phage ReqiPine5 TaxID=691963 RepID=D4P838_9CAUD|nr:Rnase E [Rhodococcus phage ReqiPine5]ADD81168.1 gp63 [Rhodococcus phage ReqiPine5]
MPPRKRQTRTSLSAQAAAKQIRAATALQLRLRDKTTAEIAKVLNTSPTTVSNDIQWYLDEIIAKPARDRVAEQLAVIADTRSSTLQLRDDLLAYLSGHIEQVQRYYDGDVPKDDKGNDLPAPEMDNNAIGKLTALNDSLIKLADHEAKLTGIYAPTKVAVMSLDENFSETAAKILGQLRDQKAITPATGTVDVHRAADHIDAEVVSVVDDPAPDDWIDG